MRHPTTGTGYADPKAIRRQVAEILRPPPPEQRAVRELARAIAELPDDPDAATIHVRAAQRYLTQARPSR